FFDNLTQYKTLQDAARLLGGGDARRKAFILVSEGIGKDLSGIFGAMSPVGQIPEVRADQPSDATGHYTITPYGWHDVALVNMMEAMRRSNVATYAIDPRRLVKSSDLFLECSPAPTGPMERTPSPGGFTASAFNGADPCSSGLSDFDSVVRQAQRGLEITSEASGGLPVADNHHLTGGAQKIVA